ncbi:MAG: 2-hydroxyacyl-CoA dehydratase family protein [Promethearchaeota archaeon]
MNQIKEFLYTPEDEPFPFKDYLLYKKNNENKKLVGILAHEMVPLELLRAFPIHIVPLIFVGPEDYTSSGGIYITHSACVFARNILGGFHERTHPIYSNIDYLIRTNYCNGDFCGLEYVHREFKVPTINFMIPFKINGATKRYFRDQIINLQKKFEDLFKVSIGDEDLLAQVKKHNELKSLLKIARESGLNGSQLLKLYQEAAILSPEDMIERIKYMHPDLRTTNQENSGSNQEISKDFARGKSPPLMLTGDSIFINDFIINWLENFGAGNIAIFDTWIGMRMEDFKVDYQSNDILDAITSQYLEKQGIERNIPRSMEKRIKIAQDLVKSHGIRGIINHTIKFCDLQAIGRNVYKDKLNKIVPVLDIERDYSKSGIGGIATRIEAFIEMISEE